MERFLISLGHAFAGICYGIRTQRHLRFHLCAAATAVGCGIWRGLAPLEWALLVLLIAAVISAELINTAIEACIDLSSPEIHPLAKAAKDTAAGAVLVLAVAALIIAVFLFLK